MRVSPLLICFLTLLFLDSNGQQIALGSCKQDEGQAIAISANHSKYVISNTTSYFEYFNRSIILTKLDADNQHLWSTLVYNSKRGNTDIIYGHDITVVNDGLLICGYLGHEKVLLIKTSLDGKVKWSKTYFSGFANKMKINSKNEILLVGTRYKPLYSKRSGFVMKLDSIGNPIWEREYYYGNTQVLDISISENNRITLSGLVTIHGGSNPTRPFLAKIDNVGNFIWDNVYFNKSSDDYLDHTLVSNLNSVIELSSGSGIVTTGNIFPHGSAKVPYAFKVDKDNGQVLWSKFYDFSSSGMCFGVLNYGEELLLYGEAAILDNATTGSKSMVVIHADEDGNVTSSRAYGTTSSDDINDLELDGKELFMVGTTSDFYGPGVSWTFDDSYIVATDSNENSTALKSKMNFATNKAFTPFHANSKILNRDSVSVSESSELLLDSIIGGTLDSSVCAPVSVFRPFTMESIQVYPNPTSGILHIESANDNGIVNIYNGRGQLVWDSPISAKKPQ